MDFDAILPTMNFQTLRHGALAAALLLGCSSAPETLGRTQPLDVQGHRGARALLPENTIPGFERALELGVSTLELDLGLSRDGVLIVSHDPRVSSKICVGEGGAPIAESGPRIRDLTLEELRRFDCGSQNPSPERFPEPPRQNRPGTPMPTLGEIFELTRALGDSRVRFNIEVKVAPGSPDHPDLRKIVTAAVEEIRAQNMVERSTLQSFDWEALKISKALEPRLRTAALLAGDTMKTEWLAGLDPTDLDMLALLQAADDFVDDFSPYWEHMVPGRYFAGHSVSAYQEAGFPVIPWTVNDAEVMKQLIALGVDGLITDRPDLLMKIVQEHRIPVAGRNP